MKTDAYFGRGHLTDPARRGISKPPEDVDFISGGKRTNLMRAGEFLPNWWVGFGKDEGCQFEGPWEDIVRLARKIVAYADGESLDKPF